MNEVLSKMDPNTIIPAIFTLLGTLLGTVLGWLLNTVSRSGKLHIYPEWEDSFLQQDGYGGEKESKNIKEAYHFKYSLYLDIYNSSANTKIMRNIEIAFYRRGNELFRVTPKDVSTRRREGRFRIVDNVSLLNIPGKTVEAIKWIGGLPKEDIRFSELWKANKIFLIYRNDKNMEKKILIKKDFNRYVENAVDKEK